MPTNFDNYPGTPQASPYAHGTATIGTTAALLCTSNQNSNVVVQNNSATAITIYLGGSTVTTTGATQGIALAQNTSLVIPALGGYQCQLYAIAASAGALVTYLFPIG